MEHFRSSNGTGEVFQWCDEEMAMIVDAVNGKPITFKSGVKPNTKIGSLSDAKEHMKNSAGWENRYIIIKLDCIAGSLISNSI